MNRWGRTRGSAATVAHTRGLPWRTACSLRALVPIALLEVLAACGAGSGAPADPQGRGGEEPVLHVYNWADYIGFRTVADFERETGIKVVYDVYDSNQLLETKLLSGDTGYDIVSTDMGFYARQIKAGAYEPLDRASCRTGQTSTP